MAGNGDPSDRIIFIDSQTGCGGAILVARRFPTGGALRRETARRKVSMLNGKFRPRVCKNASIFISMIVEHFGVICI